MRWYISGLRRYADFEGRAGRNEFWFFALFHFIAIVALVFVGVFVFYDPNDPPGDSETNYEGLFYGLYVLATLLPWIAVNVRRLHDTGRSGWWFLVSFVPLIGLITIIVIQALPGNEGENKYGPPPPNAPSKAPPSKSLDVPGISPPTPPPEDPFASRVAPPPPPLAAASPVTGADTEERLKRLQSLHRAGVVTDQEYEDQRRAIISEL